MIFRLAGIIGIDPGPRTLRELVWMADAKRSEAWDHTAELLALVANIFSKNKIKSSAFHPFAERETDKPVKAGEHKAEWQAMAVAFMNHGIAQGR